MSKTPRRPRSRSSALNRTAENGYAHARFEHLPPYERQVLRRAVKWQFFTIGYTACTITVVALVLGQSQAMKTAWIEDMISLLPQVSFLIALLFTRRPPNRDHPYGWHRAMGVGHLLAGAALLIIGGRLAFDAVVHLVTAEQPKIDDIELFGHPIWLGWLMVGVMAVIIIGPFIYGHAKAKLAPVLHNKLLAADADMAKADWQTNVASIVGVLGLGIGWWWLDGVAALFISVGIIWDGLRNCSSAIQDLMDRRARNYDDTQPHELRRPIFEFLASQPYVSDAGIRMRDEGQVFHVEVYVAFADEQVTLDRLDAISAGIYELDWKLHDIVVVPAATIPDFADRGDKWAIARQRA